MSAFNCLPFVNQSPGMVNVNTTFNPNVDTSRPPPNLLPNNMMQPGPFQPFLNPTGQQQQHMPVPAVGSHVPNPSPSLSPFSVVPPNYLQSPPLPVGQGFDPNPQQNSPAVWSNNSFENKSSVNNYHMYSGAPHAHSAFVAGNNPVPFQTPLPPRYEEKQSQIHPPVWQNSNSFNNPTFNNNSQVSDYVAPNQLLTSNYQNQQALPPPVSHGAQVSGSGGQFQTPQQSQFNGRQTENHPPVWNNSHSFGNGSFASNNSVGQVTTNQTHRLIDNHNDFNRMHGNRNVNTFQQSKPFDNNQWNSNQINIQKTNLPDLKIFNNPEVVFNMSGNNNSASSRTAENVSRNQNNQSSFNGVNNVFNAFNQNSRNDAPRQVFENRHSINSRNSFERQNRNSFNFLNSTSSKHDNSVTQPREQPHMVFKTEPPFNGGKNRTSSQQNYQNLIDIQVISDDGENENGAFQKELSAYGNNNSSNISSFTRRNFAGADLTDSVNRNSDSAASNDFNGHFTNTFKNSKNWNGAQNNSAPKMSWMSESIQNALKKRNMLFNEAKRTNNEAIWEEYRTLRDQINEEIREAKSKSATNMKKSNSRDGRKNKEKNLPFNCDTCDRSFATEMELKEHCDQHIKCNYADCNFTAHPKVVFLHQKMQHDTGYAEVINKLQNEEEIKKWREERKKRFPTAENVLKRKAEQAEKEARGEVVEDKDFGKFKRRKFGQNDVPNRFNRRERNPRQRTRSRYPFNRPQLEPQPDSSVVQNSDSDSECHIKLPRFTGMKKELDPLPSEINEELEEESNNEAPLEIPISKVPLCESEDAAASGEQDNKESDDEAPLEVPISKVPLSESEDAAASSQQDNRESEEDGPTEIPISTVPLNKSSESVRDTGNADLQTDDNKDSIDETAGEISSIKDTSNDMHNSPRETEKRAPSSLQDSANDNLKKRKYQHDRSGRRPQPPPPPNRKNSLLGMLLDDEIRHERNVIMQCVRHIVRSKFFGIGDDKCNKEES